MENQPSLGTIIAQPPRQQNRKQMTMTNFVQRPITISKSKVIDQQLVKMIVKEYHPFSVVEDKEFRNLIQMLNPSYIIPSRKTVTQSLLPQMYEMTIEKVKNQLINVSAVCMTTDGWTSLNNESFVAVTVHFIDPSNETQLSSVLLGCTKFRERHTAENLAIFLINIVDEWNLNNKIAGVLSDNASNIKSALQKCNWRYLSCFAHSINLVVQTILKSIEQTILKVKTIVKFFKKSSHALGKLQDFQKQTGLPQLKLKLDCPTRWNSTYDMFDRILSIKESIIATLAVLGNSELNCLSSEEWILLEHARDILKIFYDVTVEISADKYVTLSKEIIFVNSLNKYVSKFVNNNTLPTAIQHMAKTMSEELIKRFYDIEDNPLVTQAALLDPRFKKHVFSNSTKCANAINFLRAKIQSIILEQDTFEQQQPTIATGTTNSTTFQSILWEEFDQTVVNLIGGTNPSVAGIIEVDKYLNEPLISRFENPLAWWAERKKVYQRMYELVKRSYA